MRSGVSISPGLPAPVAPAPNVLKFFTSSLPASAIWSWVTYGGGVFVAVQNGAVAAYSEDLGVTWTSVPMPYGAQWQSVCYNNGRFIAVAYGAPVTAISDDLGKTWTAGGNMPSAAQWYAITSGEGILVAVATGPSSAAAYSLDDGASWAASTLPASSYWSGIAFGGGVFIAVQNGPTCALSKDGGATWTTSNMPSFTDWFAIAFDSSSGTFVAVANHSSHSARSTDLGATWVDVELPYSNNWVSLANDDGTFFALSGWQQPGDNQGAGAVSTDAGLTWEPLLVPPANLSNNVNVDAWLSVAYGGGAFVGVGYQSGLALVSRSVPLVNGSSPYTATPALVSGSNFVPNEFSNSFIHVTLNSTAAGTYSVTMGPNTGTEVQPFGAINFPNAVDVGFTIAVPKGWIVNPIWTNANFVSCLVVAF